MILQQLYTDSEAILQDAPTPPMYDNILIQWQIKLSDDGQFQACINLGDKGGVRHCAPYNYGRAVDIVPNLLVDTADYVLGPVAAPDDKKAAIKHQEFLALLRRCEQETHNPLVQAVLKCLAAGGVPKEKLPQDLKAKERVMFTIGPHDKKPSDEANVKEFWRRVTDEECKGRAKPRGRCLITGQDGFVERILPCEIRVGGESAPLISVNESAGNSHGFEQALNGAVSLRAAEGFTKALQSLMRNSDARVNIGDVTYVFWRRTGPDTEVSETLMRPDEGGEVVARHFTTPFRPQDKVPKRITDGFPAQFFALALSGNKTRVVFRDWLALTEWELNDYLRSWLEAQNIVSPEGESGRKGKKYPFFSVNEQAAALYRDKKEITKADVPALVRVALHGDPLPRRMLAAVVRRCCLEGQISWRWHARMALIKLALYRDDKEKSTLMATTEHMDRFNDKPAYVCGRLLSVLESIQYAALGSVNSNVIDRYLSAAAAEPHRILGGLLLAKAKNAHLAKLRRKKPGLHWLLNDQMEALLDHLGPKNEAGVPAMKERQTLEEQADFLLGYYHQHAHGRAEQKKRIAERDQKQAATPETD